mmetsp:Transcript_38654/g.96073  ORF Transcript_38654/g.96073 Transcript_38654/m.96073 type:complete len:206 (+) Transcript_38654:251-868(+)
MRLARRHDRRLLSLPYWQHQVPVVPQRSVACCRCALGLDVPRADLFAPVRHLASLADGEQSDRRTDVLAEPPVEPAAARHDHAHHVVWPSLGGFARDAGPDAPGANPEEREGGRCLGGVHHGPALTLLQRQPLRSCVRGLHLRELPADRAALLPHAWCPRPLSSDHVQRLPHPLAGSRRVRAVLPGVVESQQQQTLVLDGPGGRP